MNYIDYILVVFLVIGFLLGYKDGLIRKLIGLLGFILALFLAFQFSTEAGLFLQPVFSEDIYLSELVGGFVIFLLIIFVVSILKRVIHPTDKVNKFVNQIIGGLIGVLQMVFFISGFLLFLNLFSIPSKETRENSLLFTPVYKVIPTTLELVFGSNSVVKEYMKESIEQRDIEDKILEEPEND